MARLQGFLELVRKHESWGAAAQLAQTLLVMGEQLLLGNGGGGFVKRSEQLFQPRLLDAKIITEVFGIAELHGPYTGGIFLIPVLELGLGKAAAKVHIR